jgi:alpha,alpha-trehalase
MLTIPSWFYDFNTTGNDRSEVYTPSGTFPLWQNITPTELTNNETLALAIVSGQRYLLGKYAGLPSVNSLYESGLNWVSIATRFFHTGEVADDHVPPRTSPMRE